ncbi:somatostatin-1A isoform X5 [Anguilla rostrata]|uniref:somatostatin-1A isoform X1 n=1 Tax=Anguilla anguilla TaxID=7936 RepID=UPI0015AAAA43|nr:somatostatin-1A isoform X1 [Anguilla anguilla]XP_035267423.1 somatostatin-1A isoform X1 [Anguilla anguilla]
MVSAVLTTPDLVKRLMSARGDLQVLLVALSASVLLAQVNGAPQRDMLAELLRTDVTEGNEDLSRMLFLKIVSDLMMTGDNKVLPDPRPRSTEELRIHQDVARQLPLSQRERKAGCRNFFWKTFTSC